ncbi:kinase domain-containing protein [Nemania sp. FL0916]|nr:kinase domain-containing protein [Nemania sp. FL0916]
MAESWRPPPGLDMGLDYVEEISKYKPGGYHPVDIGDIINANDCQYEVVHKLGYGGFSTVWLVRSCGDMRSYFALKILRADVTESNELRILQHLKTGDGPKHPNLITLYDSFTISGPNEHHQCLVFPALGPSLDNFRVAEELPGPVRLHMCEQIASVLAFLHERGICHGDLTASNVAFEFPDIQPTSPDQLLEFLGPVRTEPVKRGNGPRSLDVPSISSHRPRQLVERAAVSGLDYSLFTRIRIVDFGQAFFVNDPPPSLGIPIDCFPPELCFGYLPSKSSDIWDLACVIYQVHCHSLLFPTGFRVFEILIGTIVGYLGPLPQHWKGRFDFDKLGYWEPGKVKKEVEPVWWFEDKTSEKSIVSRLSTDAPHLTSYQQEELIRILHGMLVYEPNNRTSAEDVAKRLNTLVHSDQQSGG